MNRLDEFEQSIKNKLENYEVPVDNSQWERLQEKLPKKKNMNFNYILIPAMIILLSLFPTNFKNNYDALNNFQQKTQLVDNQRIIEEIIINDAIKNDNDATNDVVKSVNLTSNDVIKSVIPAKRKDFQIEKIKPKETTQIKVIKEKDILIQIIEEKDKMVFNPDTNIIDTTITKPSNNYNIPPRLFFPTAFTPDGDGLNDEFFPVGEIDQYPFHMLIYDRWGQLVFETMNLNVKWKGENSKQGLYVYIFKIQMDDGNWVTEKGKIQLIK